MQQVHHQSDRGTSGNARDASQSLLFNVPTTPIDTNRFRAAMRPVPGAVAIITATAEGERRGITATAACSVSTNPAQLLVCVNRSSRVHDFIKSVGKFCVNYLDASQRHVADSFSNSAIESNEKFTTGEWRTHASGTPFLSGSIVTFDCLVAQSLEAGTHTIFIGRVIDVLVAGGEPLVYMDGRYSTIAGLEGEL